jgi:endonuclease YncB( thermonuclease family)
LLLLAGNTFANVFACKVIGISDGDTFTCVTVDRKKVRVRLAEIDTPEKAQPYGNRAKAALSKLIFKKTVTISARGNDRYKRVIGAVYLKDVYINREMVRVGAAWVYRRYSEDESLLIIENEARTARLGVWGQSEADIIPPWKWRAFGKGLQQAVQHAKTPKASTTSPSCGQKRNCSQMSSCEEAKFHLQTCGRKTLDRDRDGIPCESLCSR